ncbi:hypothetical protein [Natronomonas moolapensis]|uniref:hypothetical protein n=1 Tax=Natronomonas moolapensis TaxID=416273 RepID=UPI0013639E64|nr:hypothetical protein [Natronomonas moolapensis]
MHVYVYVLAQAVSRLPSAGFGASGDVDGVDGANRDRATSDGDGTGEPDDL